MSMVWRDVAADEPRIRLGQLGSALRAHHDRGRARLADARRDLALRPATAPRIALPIHAGHAGARW